LVSASGKRYLRHISMKNPKGGMDDGR
jgi:hypothetical protein